MISYAVLAIHIMNEFGLGKKGGKKGSETIVTSTEKAKREDTKIKPSTTSIR